MHDQDKPAVGGDAHMDRALQSAFPIASALPADFESRVMANIRQSPATWLQRRSVFLVMAFYWAIAAGLNAWFLSLSGTPVDSGSILAISVWLTTLAASLLPLWWLVRQNRLKLSNLILRTLQ